MRSGEEIEGMMEITAKISSDSIFQHRYFQRQSLCVFYRFSINHKTNKKQ